MDAYKRRPRLSQNRPEIRVPPVPYGEQWNFPQSVEGNDSRASGDESRDASRLREYKGGKGGEKKNATYW